MHYNKVQHNMLNRPMQTNAERQAQQLMSLYFPLGVYTGFESIQRIQKHLFDKENTCFLLITPRYFILSDQNQFHTTYMEASTEHYLVSYTWKGSRCYILLMHLELIYLPHLETLIKAYGATTIRATSVAGREAWIQITRFSTLLLHEL